MKGDKTQLVENEEKVEIILDGKAPGAKKSPSKGKATGDKASIENQNNAKTEAKAAQPDDAGDKECKEEQLIEIAEDKEDTPPPVPQHGMRKEASKSSVAGSSTTGSCASVKSALCSHQSRTTLHCLVLVPLRPMSRVRAERPPPADDGSDKPSTSKASEPTRDSSQGAEDTSQKADGQSAASASGGAGDADDADTGDIMEMGHGHPLHMTQPAGVLCLWAVLAALCAAGFTALALASFVLLPELDARVHIKVESKWVNAPIAVCAAGAFWLLRIHRRRSPAAAEATTPTTALTATLTACLAAAGSAAVTCIVHVIAVVFRKIDEAHYARTDVEEAEDARMLAYVNGGLAVLGAVACVVAMLMYRHVLHLTGKNFGYTMHVDKHRLRLSLLGLAQVICGIMVTVWWISLEVFSQGRNTVPSGLPTSALMSHGILFTAAGYIQMMATAKGAQPLLIVAAMLNAAALIMAANFTHKPFSLMYYVISHTGDMTSTVFDGRMWLSLMLILCYTVQLGANVYSLIRFVHLAAGDRISRIDGVLKRCHWRGWIRMLSWMQMTIGLLYTLFDTAAFALFYLYKLDFTPLPLFIVLSGIFGAGSITMGSVTMLTITTSLSLLCVAFSTRDIYLFLYHLLSRGTPDALEGGGGRLSGATLVVHMALALLALLEIIVAMAVLLGAIRSTAAATMRIYSKMQCRTATLWLTIISNAQMIVAAFMLVAGFILFTARALYLEQLGDTSITLSLVALGAGVLQRLSCHSDKATPAAGGDGAQRPAGGQGALSMLLLPAVGAQLCTFTLVWQSSDMFAYLIHDHLADAFGDGFEAHNDQVEPHTGALFLAAGVFVCLLLHMCFSAASLALMGCTLERSKFARVDPSDPERTKELLANTQMHNGVDSNGHVDNGHAKQNGGVHEMNVTA